MTLTAHFPGNGAYHKRRNVVKYFKILFLILQGVDIKSAQEKSVDWIKPQ